MEFVTLFLSALLGILSPMGFVTDEVAETALRQQLHQAEALTVRIDNTPSYQLLQGRIDRVRIAGQGLYPIAGVRIAALELESDPIALSPNFSQLELKAPLQAAIKLVLTEADINQVLKSDRVAESLNDLNLDFAVDHSAQNNSAQKYDIVDPQFDFLDTDRFRLQLTLQGQQTGEQTEIIAESGLEVLSGQQLRLIEPVVSLGDEAIESRFLSLLVENVSQQFLNQLEDRGITARVLKLEIAGDRLTVASFVRVEPEAVDNLEF